MAKPKDPNDKKKLTPTSGTYIRKDPRRNQPGPLALLRLLFGRGKR